MKIFVAFLLILSLSHEGICLPNEIPFSTCDEILQQYNVNPTTDLSNFVIKSSVSTYTTNEFVHLEISSTTPGRTFIGILLLAQDDKNTNVGSWIASDSLFENVSCGGVMHNSKIEKTSVEVDWFISSAVTSSITIKAIIIENNNSVYTSCSITLTLRVLNNSSIDDENVPPPETTMADITTHRSTITPPVTTMETTQSTTTSSSSTTMSTTQSTAASSASTTMDTTQSPTAATSVLTTTPLPVPTTLTPSPTNDVAINASWTFDTATNVTSVNMTINHLREKHWAALGLSLNQTMGEAHVFMCQRLNNGSVVVRRYVNPHHHDDPDPAGPNQGGIFTPDRQQFDNGVVTCLFNLSNFSTPISGPFQGILPLSQSTEYYPIFAVGQLDGDDVPQQHSKDSCKAQSVLVKLNQDQVVLYKINSTDDDGGDTIKYIRVHGIIMVFAWMFIVSTGILISRYFKNAWTNNIICGKAAWFAAHRFLMSIAVILTIIGFFFIFVFLEGAWVDVGPTRAYAHSITGVLVICLAFFQPFIALFRCEPDSRYRFIFNYIHAFIGFATFALSVATLYLATYFHLFKDNSARIIMIIWIIYIILIVLAFEIVKIYFGKKAGTKYANINSSNTTVGELVERPGSSTITLIGTNDQQGSTFEQKLKNGLLAIHILTAAILSIVFATLIAKK